MLSDESLFEVFVTREYGSVCEEVSASVRDVPTGFVLDVCPRKRRL